MVRPLEPLEPLEPLNPNVPKVTHRRVTRDGNRTVEEEETTTTEVYSNKHDPREDEFHEPQPRVALSPRDSIEPEMTFYQVLALNIRLKLLVSLQRPSPRQVTYSPEVEKQQLSVRPPREMRSPGGASFMSGASISPRSVMSNVSTDDAEGCQVCL